jgi:hypothetical protein
MPSIRRLPSRRSLLAILGVAATLFGLAMLHPYPRQSLFGPTIRGKPWCVRDAEMRRFVHQEKFNDSLRGRFYIWLGLSTGELTIDLDDPDMGPLYAELLVDPDLEVSGMVLSLVAQRENLHQADLLPALRRNLENSDPRHRLLAVEAIWKISKDTELSGVLFRELEDQESQRRELAMALMTPICESDPGLCEKIIPYAQDTDPNVRAQTMAALGAFGKVAMTTLIAGVNDEDAGVVRAAAVSLGQLGPDAKDAFPPMERVIYTRRFPHVGECGTFSTSAAIYSALNAIDRKRAFRVMLNKEILDMVGKKEIEQWLGEDNPHRRELAAEILLVLDPARYKHLKAK